MCRTKKYQTYKEFDKEASHARSRKRSRIIIKYEIWSDVLNREGH